MIQTQNDYVLISLDKNNARWVLGAFDIRSGKKVEAAAEGK